MGAVANSVSRYYDTVCRFRRPASGVSNATTPLAAQPGASAGSAGAGGVRVHTGLSAAAGLRSVGGHGPAARGLGDGGGERNGIDGQCGGSHRVSGFLQIDSPG